jgi:hypothetical protein
VTGLGTGILLTSIAAGAPQTPSIPSSFSDAVRRARNIEIKPGPEAIERIRQRLGALAGVRHEAGNIGRAGEPAAVGKAAAEAAALYADTAREIGRADPPKSTDPVTYAAYREQADRWATMLRAEAEGAWQSCIERGEEAAVSECARVSGLSARKKPSQVADEAARLTTYLASRRRELSACWVLLPAESSAKLPKRVEASLDLHEGVAKGVDVGAGADLPQMLRDCIADKVYLWKFPVAGDVQVEVPFEIVWVE